MNMKNWIFTKFKKQKKGTNNITVLKDKYRDRIHVCKKNINELVDFIKKKFNVIENVELEKSYLKEVELTKINALNSWKNLKQQYKYDDLDVIVFEIIKDDKSESYYKSHASDLVISKSNVIIPNRIVVIFETKTEYIYCNNDLLNKEIMLYRGIDEDDIMNDTPQLITYLRLLEELENSKK